jgi:tryptophan halogenase
VRDFIILHYLLNRREDGEFWRANRNAAPPASLAQTLDFYDQSGIVDWQHHSLFREPSFYSIAAGFERLPRTHHPMADQVDTEKAWQILQNIKARNLALARTLPDHGALIAAVNAVKGAAPR